MGDIVTSNSQRPGRAKPFQGLKGVRVGPFMTLACSMETEKLFNIEEKNPRKQKWLSLPDMDRKFGRWIQ